MLFSREFFIVRVKVKIQLHQVKTHCPPATSILASSSRVRIESILSFVKKSLCVKVESDTISLQATLHVLFILSVSPNMA